MPHRTLVVVPLVRAEPPLAEQVRAAVAAGADMIELRVDLIGDVEAVAALLSLPHVVPFILTVRSAAEGGGWDGDDAERIALLERLGLLQPGYVDVELDTWERSANLQQKIGLVCETRELDRDTVSGSLPTGSKTLTSEFDSAATHGLRAASQDEAASTRRPRNTLILSHHDWREASPEIGAAFERLAAAPSGVLKAAFRVQDARNAFRILGELHPRAAQRCWMALGMGEAGLITRVLAGKFGAFATFAALDAQSASAPGQPALRELLGKYNFRRVGPATRVYGVVGWPVGHSRSPLIHNAGMRQRGIDGVYLPLPVSPGYESFAAFMDYIVSNPWLDFRGLSITIPHKENALRWLAARGGQVSSLGQRCGAVNTLLRRDDGVWCSDNTDAAGAHEALRAALALRGDKLEGVTVDILGAGGAAKAIAAVMLEQGCQVIVYNRNALRAAKMADALGCGHRSWDERLHRGGQVVINCTPVGMWPNVNETPLPAESLSDAPLVLDTIYNPPQTRLLREARGAGCETVSGVEMFIGQAARQFERWHGGAAPLGVFRAVMRAEHER